MRGERGEGDVAGRGVGRVAGGEVGVVEWLAGVLLLL